MTRTQPTTIADLVAASGRLRRLGPGEPLFFEGDLSHSAYSCISGRLKIFLTLSSGRELVLATRGPGEGFGELAAIDRLPRSASVAAIEPTVVAQMSGDEFLDELLREPVLAAALLREMAEQVRRMTARLSARNSDTATVRTGHMLLELAGLVRRHGPASARVVLPITQGDLADRIGATRESTARALALFRRAGVVETQRGRVVVSDFEGLEALIRAM